MSNKLSKSLSRRISSLVRLIVASLCGLGLSLTASAVESCEVNTNRVGATYQVTKTEIKSGKVLTQETVNFWRLDKQVAYEYTNQKTTEIWNLVSNGQVRPVRFFDKEKRAIEYQPLEINQGRGDRDWSSKSEIISLKQRNQMQSVSKSGNACDKSESFTDQNGRELIWLSNLKLPKLIKIQSMNTVTEWKLEKTLSELETVKAAFSSRANYKMTDYADIGDNESDPFLMRWEGSSLNSQQSPFSLPAQKVTKVKSGHHH